MKKKKRYAAAWLLLWICILSGCAKDGGEEIFQGEPKDLDPWTYVEDTSISMNSALTNLAASSAELGITVGVMGITFSVFFMVLRICFTKNAAVREEVKREAVMKGMIAVMLFSIPFWLGIFKYFSELLV
nr:hypothetical protein [uncultured Schaedlerella sp.]